MEIDDALIDKLAMLSRLQFNGDERTTIKKDLSNMITFVEKLNELETSGIEPLMHISNNINILREDIISQGSSQEEALSNAAIPNGPYFKVPKVINK